MQTQHTNSGVADGDGVPVGVGVGVGVIVDTGVSDSGDSGVGVIIVSGVNDTGVGVLTGLGGGEEPASQV